MYIYVYIIVLICKFIWFFFLDLNYLKCMGVLLKVDINFVSE